MIFNLTMLGSSILISLVIQIVKMFGVELLGLKRITILLPCFPEVNQ